MTLPHMHILKTHILGLYNNKEWYTSPSCGPLNVLQLCNGTFRAEEKQPGSADTRAHEERTDIAWIFFPLLNQKHGTGSATIFSTFLDTVGSLIYSTTEAQGEAVWIPQ